MTTSKKHIQTQTEWEEEMAGRVLDFIKSELYLDLPFMGIALGKLLPAVRENLTYMGTDGIYVYYDRRPLLRLFQKNPKFLDRVYLHTVLHCVFSHLWIGGQRNRQLWHLACDIAVEYVIDHMDKPCTRRILSYLRQNTYKEIEAIPQGISAATIYLWLLDRDSSRLVLLNREYHTDDHRFWPKEEQQNARSQQSPEAEWRQIARQTRMEQKKKGSETSEGEQVLAALLSAQKSRRSYREFLRQFSILREEVHANPDEYDLSYYTYGLRIYGNMPLIEPLESREIKKIREFIIVLDTSYSTSGGLVKNFLKETYTLLSQSDSFFSRSRIRIIQCDDRVRMDQLITSAAEMEHLLKKFTLVGGGGTDFRPAFAYVNSLIREGTVKNLSGLLYFTDGKGTYPKKRPDYKTAFLFLGPYDSDAVPPWGIQFQLEPAEFTGRPPVSDFLKNQNSGEFYAGEGNDGLFGPEVSPGDSAEPGTWKESNLQEIPEDWDDEDTEELPNT